MLANIFLIVGGYLFGALPFAVALARMGGLDASQEEDLHIALWHKTGRRWAILAGVVDFLKGIILMLIGFGFGLSAMVVVFSGVAAVAGQMWPPFRICHGERGNLVGAGIVFTLPLLYGEYWVLLSLIFFATGAALKYYYENRSITSLEMVNKKVGFPNPAHPMALSLPAGMLLGFVAAPVISWCSGGLTSLTLGFLALLIIIVVRRLTAELRDDVREGNCTVRVLLNRFLFDQPFIEGEGE
jgi:glycerol-3-phosphate acyltransferase PlsY